MSIFRQHCLTSCSPVPLTWLALAQDKEQILDKVCRLVPSLRNAAVVQDWVGLRPYREPVRLQLQHVKVSLHMPCWSDMYPQACKPLQTAGANQTLQS